MLALLVVIGGCAAAPQHRAEGGSKGPREKYTLAAPAVVGAAHEPGDGAAHTAGGNGGRIVRVTTLAAHGTGSLDAALELPVPRTIVFEVGGVIDLAGHALNVKNPYVTIAGQTAPSPGITLIRGGIDVRTHDVVVEQLRVRTGEAGFAKHSGWERDGLSTHPGAANVVVDHCSFAWATDENLSASGERFAGPTPDAWRAATSHALTYSNNIIAEGLAFSTHGKPGEHSKGTLVHDNITDILIVGNLYAHNGQRNALFKGGARGAFVNNLIYDPGKRALHYNLWAKEWGDHPYQTGRIVAIGNVLQGGPSTDPAIAFFMLGGEGDVELYGDDNLALAADGAALPPVGRYGGATGNVLELHSRPSLPLGLDPLPAAQVAAAVLAHAGARAWERDAVDRRIVEDVRTRGGRIIDSEAEGGGYPHTSAPTRRAFVETEWVLATMRRRDGTD
jgi:pectate lyase